MVERERLPIDETFDRVELVHHHKVRVLMVEVDRIKVSLKQLLVDLVVSSLLQLQVLDCATHFEEVLDDVVLLSTVLA